MGFQGLAALLRALPETITRAGLKGKFANAKANAVHGRERADGREAKRRADLDALVAKVRSGRAEEGDLMRYLELTMPDDPEEAGNAGGW